MQSFDCEPHDTGVTAGSKTEDFRSSLPPHSDAGRASARRARQEGDAGPKTISGRPGLRPIVEYHTCNRRPIRYWIEWSHRQTLVETGSEAWYSLDEARSAHSAYFLHSRSELIRPQRPLSTLNSPSAPVRLKLTNFTRMGRDFVWPEFFSLEHDRDNTGPPGFS
jgi:hypothetical protein